MRKTTFTKSEYNELKKLISKKVLADRNEQKKIRNSIRKIGFHFSDFSSKKGYDISDLENLVHSGEIKIQGNDLTVNKTQTKPKKNIRPITNSLNVNVKDPFAKTAFVDFINLSQTTLNKTGLYCIRLKSHSKLPNRYQNILDQRNHRIIYIGKAQGQSLRDRLNQEIYHTSPGTFFRSIGAVLNYTPIPGHLKDKRNQKNYKFSVKDTLSITDWLLNNTEFSIYPVEGDFSIENELIKKYCPLLNDKSNPLRLTELREDRKKCREIAVG
jgi:hypothetical protein